MDGNQVPTIKVCDDMGHLMWDVDKAPGWFDMRKLCWDDSVITTYYEENRYPMHTRTGKSEFYHLRTRHGSVILDLSDLSHLETGGRKRKRVKDVMNVACNVC